MLLSRIPLTLSFFLSLSFSLSLSLSQSLFFSLILSISVSISIFNHTKQVFWTASSTRTELVDLYKCTQKW